METTGLGDGWEGYKFGSSGEGRKVHFQRYLGSLVWEIHIVIRILKIFIQYSQFHVGQVSPLQLQRGEKGRYCQGQEETVGRECWLGKKVEAGRSAGPC